MIRSDNNRNGSFRLREVAKIYGGFVGTESLVTARNPATNITILSGDIDKNDINTMGIISPTPQQTQGTNSNYVILQMA
ncbi:MAG: hypothetical protein R2880_11120 [Deinococcales bacterium]